MTGAVRILVAGLILTSVIAWMIADRVMALANGREIVVAAQPVDPRDLFRGDYVVLSYDFSSMDSASVEGLESVQKDWSGRRTIYVQLRPENGRHVLARASAAPLDNVPADHVVLKGTTSGTMGRIFIRYGVERYFVPEGHGRRIEDGVRDAQVDLVLSVGEDGTPAIKALRLNGEEIYREGLF